MKERFLEAGEIVNTHGIHGEVKIYPWSDTPEFLCQFGTIYIEGEAKKVLAMRRHKGMVLASLEGVDTVEKAMSLKGKKIQIDRNDVELPEGRHFLVDLMGLEVIDADSGEPLGTIQDIWTLPAQEVYVVRGKGKEYRIPAVDEFLVETNIEKGYVKVKRIEGMDLECIG